MIRTPNPDVALPSTSGRWLRALAVPLMLLDAGAILLSPLRAYALLLLAFLIVPATMILCARVVHKLLSRLGNQIADRAPRWPYLMAAAVSGALLMLGVVRLEQSPLGIGGVSVHGRVCTASREGEKASREVPLTAAECGLKYRAWVQIMTSFGLLSTALVVGRLAEEERAERRPGVRR
jgi:hypothetical protein